MDQRRADGVLLLRRRPGDPARVRHGRTARTAPVGDTGRRRDRRHRRAGPDLPGVQRRHARCKGLGHRDRDRHRVRARRPRPRRPRQPTPPARLPAHARRRRRHRRAPDHRRGVQRRPLVHRARGRGRALPRRHPHATSRESGTARPTSSSRSRSGSHCSSRESIRRLPASQWACSRPPTRRRARPSSGPGRCGAPSASSRRRSTHGLRAPACASPCRRTNGSKPSGSRGRAT